MASLLWLLQLPAVSEFSEILLPKYQIIHYKAEKNIEKIDNKSPHNFHFVEISNFKMLV